MRKIVAAPFVSLDGVVEMSPQWAIPYLTTDLQRVIQHDVIGEVARRKHQPGKDILIPRQRHPGPLPAPRGPGR